MWGLRTPTCAPLAAQNFFEHPFLVFPLAGMTRARNVMAPAAARPDFHDLAGFPGKEQEACRAAPRSSASFPRPSSHGTV